MSEKSPLLVRAKSYVMWLIARRDYSRRQLEEKLKKRELAPDEIKDLLSELAEAGFYVEDAFKKSRTRQLMRRGLGPRALQMKLRSEKITLLPTDIDEALATLNTTLDAQALLVVEKELRRLDRRKDVAQMSAYERKQRIVQALLRKGYTAAQALEALNSQ